jgi:cytosine deaminase
MLRRAMMIGYRQGMNEDAELALLFSIVTERTSATMGFPAHALAPGGAADLVLLDAAGPVEAVATVPPRRLVMKAGAVVAENGALT